jgi:hypothetical protein
MIPSRIEDAYEDIAAATVEATRTVAATVATNDEGRTLNELSHAQRDARGEVDDTTTASGSDGLPIGAGDLITTRKNDSALGVANRQTWTVQSIHSDGTVWVFDATCPPKHRRSVALPSAYVGEHVHLAYAATAYGVQGVTTTSAHTLLSEALDASGVYVGMTRSRDSNVLHIVAGGVDAAREQFTDALQRDRADRGLEAATADVALAVAGLSAEGPVKVVNDEQARLVEIITRAEQEAARWEHAAGLLAAQVRTHAHEDAFAHAAVAQAETRLATVRDEALRPLLAQAKADGHAYLDAQNQQSGAWDATRSTNRLGIRAARRKLNAATTEAHAAQETALDRWGSTPAPGRLAATTRDGLEGWAARVAQELTEAQPAVTRARQDVERAGEALKQTRWRHRAEIEELTIGVYGRDAASFHAVVGTHGTQNRARSAQQVADRARAALERIESLPVGRAVQFIESRQAQAAQTETMRTAAARRAQLGSPVEDRHESRDTRPGLGM